MPFPINLESLLAAGYVFLRSETCPACQEPVEVFTTPGKREIALNPMCELLRPAVRHYETCNVTPKQEATNGSTGNDVQDAQGRDSDRSVEVSSGHASREVREADNEPSVQRGLPVGGHDAQGSGIKLYGVRDPNYQLIAVGWDDGVLVCQWAKGKGQHTGIPEDLYLELRRVPFAYRTYQNKIKGKFPYTKLE